jgi:hypothetical protein
MVVAGGYEEIITRQRMYERAESFAIALKTAKA